MELLIYIVNLVQTKMEQKIALQWLQFIYYLENTLSDLHDLSKFKISIFPSSIVIAM